DKNERPNIGPEHQLPPPQPPRRKFSSIIVWIIILLIFAGIFTWVLRKHENTTSTSGRSPRAGGRGGAAGGPASVSPATAQKGDIGIYLEAIGTVTPVYTSSIASQVNGIVTAVHYKEGQ